MNKTFLYNLLVICATFAFLGTSPGSVEENTGTASNGGAGGNDGGADGDDVNGGDIQAQGDGQVSNRSQADASSHAVSKKSRASLSGGKGAKKGMGWKLPLAILGGVIGLAGLVGLGYVGYNKFKGSKTSTDAPVIPGAEVAVDAADQSKLAAESISTKKIEADPSAATQVAPKPVMADGLDLGGKEHTADGGSGKEDADRLSGQADKPSSPVAEVGAQFDDGAQGGGLGSPGDLGTSDMGGDE